MAMREWERYEKEKLLLGGRWLPITGSVIFVRSELEACVEAWERFWRPNTVSRFGVPRRVREVRGEGLEGLLSQLLPLRKRSEHKELFVRTANPQWVAMVTDEFHGMDDGATLPWGAQGFTAVKVTDYPNTLTPDGRGPGFFGHRKFTLVEPCEPWEARGRTRAYVVHTVRTVLTDGGWEFSAGFSGGSGVQWDVPFPVGKVWDETARRTSDRFSHEHLVTACERLGLRPFDEDFYAPDGTGLMIERVDPAAVRSPGYTLAQARHEEPWQ